MNLDLLKIGVLGGGISGEREISLLSAKEVYKVLTSKGLDTVFIDVITSDRAEVKKLICAHNLGVVFVALHGEFGEDGRIQSILEDIGIVYTGSGPRGSLLAMDKVLSKNIFRKNNISTPDFFVCFDSQRIPHNISYPAVVKPHFCGSSLGVSVATDRVSLKKAVENAFSYKSKVIIEEYIEGRELTVGILDDEPLAVVEIIPKKGYFDFLYALTDFYLERNIVNKARESSIEAACIYHNINSDNAYPVIYLIFGSGSGR